MRIRYTKPGGREVDLPDGAARRLIASGQAEEVVDFDARVYREPQPGDGTAEADRTEPAADKPRRSR